MIDIVNPLDLNIHGLTLTVDVRSPHPQAGIIILYSNEQQITHMLTGFQLSDFAQKIEQFARVVVTEIEKENENDDGKQLYEDVESTTT